MTEGAVKMTEGTGEMTEGTGEMTAFVISSEARYRIFFLFIVKIPHIEDYLCTISHVRSK
jgi:hypothetical protein